MYKIIYNSQTIFDHIFSHVFLVHFSITTFFQKAKRKMKNGHFKNVQKSKPKKSFENTPFLQF
jgi:hypothetical protein